MNPNDLPLREVAAIEREAARVLLPPRRMSVSQAATEYLRNDRDAWDAELAPMMVEPMNLIGTRDYRGIVLVAAARSSKTFSLVHGGLTYVVTCSPGDTLVTQMSQEAARDFSRVEVDRVMRNSPAMLDLLSTRARDDNVFDKYFRHGMALKIGWPAISQLSSKTLKYVFIPDYDRPTNRDNVDGEGTIWSLASKRLETYMSRGKCIAESSPGEDLIDSAWVPSSEHEAPPVKGILAIYNQGTRARWYFRCIHCGTYFQAEPGLGNFSLPSFEELSKMVKDLDLMAYAEEKAIVACKTCGGVHRIEDRRSMSKSPDQWLHEGEKFDDKGRRTGSRRRVDIASYWLGGVAAMYQRWDALLFRYLQGIYTYVTANDETALRTSTLTDQAAPYVPRNVAQRRSIEVYKSRLESWERGTVPEGVRFLIAAVDVQLSRFVVHVYGFGVGLECWVVDRHFITASARSEGELNAGLAPASYLEDWDVIRTAVVERLYTCWNGVKLPIQLTVCDSGGAEGVTQKAYEFYRQMKERGHARRFGLVKGNNKMDAPRVFLSWPDTRGRTHDAGARGDIPLWLINTNLMKDAVIGDLDRTERGPGFVHLPRWLDADFYSELLAEQRTDKGWKNELRKRNEAFDLHCYARAACALIDAEKIDWVDPPIWARVPLPEKEGKSNLLSIEELARQLNS